MIRVYLDTNVLVMGILKKDSNSRNVLDLVSEGAIREVKEAIENGTIIEEYVDDRPLPSYLIYGKTSKLRPIHVVVGVDEEVAAIITVYEPDPAKWIDFTKRR